MKIHIDLPWGGNLTIEREPMAEGKFYAMCAAIAFSVVVVAFFGIFK